jgi:ABC-type branched-subunit amino acid transport system substrate-binding protein
MRRKARCRIKSVSICFALAALISGCERVEEVKKPAAKKKRPEVTLPAKKSALPQQGVTEDEIKIGQWSPQTGPAALWGAVARGTDSYFKLINEKGGIHGRKLTLLIRDDSYQPSKTISVVKELVEKHKVFAFVGGVGTATGMAVRDYLMKRKIPWISPASGSSRWTDPVQRYLFSIFPTYHDEASLLTKYAVDELGSKKIAFFYQNDDYGKEGLMGAENRLAKYGMKLVEKVPVEVAETDISSHVLKLKKSGADTVIMWLLPKHAAMTLGIAAKIGFKPRWITSSTLSDAEMMYGLTKGLWEGVIFGSVIELPDSEHPRMKIYREAYKKYALKANPKERWSTFFIAGFYFAEPLVEALKRAGRALTRGSLIKALESIKDWDEGIGPPITFAKGIRQGTRSIFIAKCENGKAKKISDWLTMEE